MKWILFVLIGLNVGFGGYQYWQANQPAAIKSSAAVATLNNLLPTQYQVDRLQSSKRAAVQAPSQNLPTQCIRIIGLVSGDSVQIVLSRLKALEVNAIEEPSSHVIKTDFQVVLGPFGTLRIARSKLAEVKAAGIESYVMTSGSNANAISLGVFSSRANALRKQAELAAMKITASIVANEHLSNGVNLVIDPSSAALVSDDTLSSMLSKFEKAEYLRYNCI
jgi:cell division septation protein DedD